MHRHSTLTLSICSLGWVLSAGMPAHAEHSLLSPNEVHQIDMEEAWQRQLSVPAAKQSIVDHKIFVHTDSTKQYVEVVGKASAAKKTDAGGAASPEGVIYARYLLEVTEPDADGGSTTLTRAAHRSSVGMMSSDHRRIGGLGKAAFGRGEFASSGLLDLAEAERLARNDIRRLKRRGIDAEIKSREVRRVRLYTLCDDGTIECRDAETGELVWLRRVGTPNSGYGGMGMSDDFLTVVNGGEMIRLDTHNGQIFGTEQLRYVPLRGVRHCGNHAIVPSIGNRIIAYPLDDSHRDIFQEMVSGDALAMPVKAIGSRKVCWGSANGFVYVMEVSGEPAIQFRLNTDGIVNGAPAAAPGDRFFFGSEAGQIYGLRATRTGIVLWSQPTGDPIYDSPYFFDEKVLFRSTYGNLFCVDAADGKPIWDQPIGSISQVISVLDGRIFARTLSGSMVVIDLSSGSVIHRLNSISPMVLQTNIETDRIYLVNHRGTIQCLRPPGKDMPTIATQTEAKLEEKDSGKDQQKAKPSAPATDPFGAGAADPFGAGGGADPFAPAGGGAADPFAPAGGSDPFAPSGDGADPFGGNPF